MRIDGRDLRSKHKPLWEVVPLDTPYLIYIEPTNQCNLRCKFCPTSDFKLLRDVGRPTGNMDLKMFVKVVDQLAKFATKIKRVNLYKDGEPLMNSYFIAMIKYLRLSGVTEQIWTKTNGVHLTPGYNKRLVNSGIDMVGVSVKGVSSSHYMEVAGRAIHYLEYVKNIADLYVASRGKCEIYISIADTGLTDEQKEKYYADFEDKCDYIAIEGLHGWSMSNVKDFTLGHAGETFDGNPLTEKIVCPWTLYSLTINHNGDVAPCNEDWAYKCIVGNINEESIKDIWNGKRLYEFRKMHLEARRSDNLACAECHYLRTLPDDNIDSHRLEILEKLSENS